MPGLAHRHEQVGQAPVLGRVRDRCAPARSTSRPCAPATSTPSGRRSPTRRRRARPGSARWRGRSRRRARSSPGTTSPRRAGSAGRKRACCSSVPNCDERRRRSAPRRCGRPGPGRRHGRTPRRRSPAGRAAPPPYWRGHPSPIHPPCAELRSQRRRSSNRSCSRPGPPPPTSAANSPESRRVSHSPDPPSNSASGSAQISVGFGHLRLRRPGRAPAPWRSARATTGPSSAGFQRRALSTTAPCCQPSATPTSPPSISKTRPVTSPDSARPSHTTRARRSPAPSRRSPLAGAAIVVSEDAPRSSRCAPTGRSR